MIRADNVAKYFGAVCAAGGISLEIPEGQMYGILGTNGAGKTTLLRMLAGILEPDSGGVFVDGEPVYENPACKEALFYLPDTPYYFPNADMEEMVRFYRGSYPKMEREKAASMADSLNLDMHLPLRTFSKGMKRQAFLVLALCTGTKYLLCDEIFDGLDPIAAEIMKSLFRAEMKEREFTVAAAAHKLKDLEDICTGIGIMHKGGILRSGSLRERNEDVHKLQCVFRDGKPEEIEQDVRGRLSLLFYERDGFFTTLAARGGIEEIRKVIMEKNPVFFEEVPMTLEEIFLAELKEAGYDIQKVLW